MRPIPPKLKDNMSSDPYYKKCCVTGSTSEKIDFHHNLIFGGRQVNEKFCILPLAKSIHDNIVKYKEICDWIMWSRANEDEIRRYSKANNYIRTRDILIGKYGKYNESWKLLS